MKVLVTGAGGFLGMHLCYAMAQWGWDIIAVGRSDVPKPLLEIPGLQWIQQDLSVENASSSWDDVGVVFHLAAQLTGSVPVDHGFVANNELATIAILKRYAGPNTKIIYTSTQMVYGDPNSVAVDENYPVDVAFSAYGASKLHAENWVHYFQKFRGGEAVILRLTGFVESRDSIIGHFISCAREDRAIELFSMGKTCRDYLSVGDVVRVLLQAATLVPGDGVKVYNIGSGDAVATVDLARVVCAEMNSASKIIPVEKAGPRRNFVFDIQKACRELEFRPTPLVSAIRQYSRNIYSKPQVCQR